MIVGIDASNIRAGGGVTHLVELLRVAKPSEHGFEKVMLWAPRATLAKIEDRPWLVKRSDPLLEGNYLQRLWWQRYRVGQLARVEKCDLLFVPGGLFFTNFRPVVTMSRNLLPFELQEVRRYGVSSTVLKLLFLRWAQARSFRRADGVIFLTRYARDIIMRVTGEIQGKIKVIPHGVDKRFFKQPRPHRADLSKEFSILYVSHIEPYKYHWHVIEAVARLRRQGIPIVLDLVGAPGNAIRKLFKALLVFDRDQKFIKYHGLVPFEKIASLYHQADIFVFASGCENMPNTLVEAMAAGLPIACSNYGSMVEILGDGGIYFDPKSPRQIEGAIVKLLGDPHLRAEKSWLAYERAKKFSWSRTADSTFLFFSEILQDYLP